MALTDHNGALVPVSEQDAALTYKVATNAATLCGQIVKATAQSIQGRKYVKVEGWLAIAAAHGCLVSIREVRMIEGGVMAVAELRRVSDQALLATAEGFVGDDEPMWAKRPMFARRAMAQTRASSRVCRSAFAHVVVLIDKDLGTTPAEEMQGAIEAEQVHVIGNLDKASLVEEARRDGTLTNPNDDRSTYQIEAAKKAKEWADNAIGTLNLSGQTKDSLQSWWKANTRKLTGLEERHAAQYERVLTAYDTALDGAARTAA